MRINLIDDEEQRRRYFADIIGDSRQWATVMFDVFPTNGLRGLLSTRIYLLENLYALPYVLENASQTGSSLSFSGKRSLILDNPSSFAVLVDFVKHSCQPKLSTITLTSEILKDYLIEVHIQF